MHLLATTGGVVDGGAEAIDLRQTPADMIFLTAADSEIALVAAAHDPQRHSSLRIANLLQLQHSYSVDLYLEKTAAKAKLIIVRLLGGLSYWAYGIEQLEALAREHEIALAILPGDRHSDPDLAARSRLAPHHCDSLWRYLAAGGTANAGLFLDYCRHLIAGGDTPKSASEPESAGVYKSIEGTSQAGLIFYRAAMDGGQTPPIDALMDSLSRRGIGVTAIYVASLKDTASVSAITAAFAGRKPDVIVNCTSFAASSSDGGDPLARYDCPVLQASMSTGSRQSWEQSAIGLSPRDLAMSIVLPELDGRITARPISFKDESYRHEACECSIVTQVPAADRIGFVADLAASWITLRQASPAQRRVAIVLANYPVRDGRIANGVGYDTPASTIAILRALQAAGYGVDSLPGDGNELIESLAKARHKQGITYPLANYARRFEALPEIVRDRITARWGAPNNDPGVTAGIFNIAALRFGNIVVGLQPSRGYDIDPATSHHDPDLAPPHAYLAFYFWMRDEFGAHAVIHNGKHGNLEWLPGKAVGLSHDCFPEACLGPLPHLYPFIVNDPGEGAQAKRRANAVIIDHLTPPLTRAESYGALRDLEALVDEYYQAMSLDPRRAVILKRDILDLTRRERLDVDAGLTGDEDADLRKLDTFLCDLKEAQIRDGLHIFGASPQGEQERDLLVALTRAPRGLGEGKDQSLIRALADDFGLTEFDPLTCRPADPWQAKKPAALQEVSSDPWRSNADTVERLELYARSFTPAGEKSRLVFDDMSRRVRPALQACGASEIDALLRGLNGGRVEPGPSGAPTRGRLDVLPTGRNFFSIDNRTLPTPAAWRLGEKSAQDVLARHFQDFGAYPKTLGLSAWGTSNMRTGGDDIAQALAFIGTRPIWEPSSWRVTGFEVVPLAKLGRPRVDVTLRISGFFRDAFPLQIELLDRAIRAVCALDEDERDNPLAARFRSEVHAMQTGGMAEGDARLLAGQRIFGSKPGAYGAGLQALIDERIWDGRSDLAAAYVAWGSYAYGVGLAGRPMAEHFNSRLRHIEAVLHNQDNREHDLLDSDDYYQFEGGMSAAVEEASGKRPRAYHNDHSLPERPLVRTLEEEISRVMRSRVINPKWISGVKRHGYKGAFEIAATVDYMFAFAATTGTVKTHHFDLAYDAFIVDDDTRGFIQANNPAALREIAQRLEEAAARGLWTPRLNSAYDRLMELKQ